MEKLANFFSPFQNKYNPEFAIITGSGLGSILEKAKIFERIPYKDIPNFPVSTVVGHASELVFAQLGKHNVVFFNGRFHYYEGYSMEEVTITIRASEAMGVKNLIVSNASGAVNPTFKAGDLMLIKDHVNFILADNPLRGVKGNEKFVNMTNVYDEEFRKIVKTIAFKHNIPIKEGVYCAVMGPSFETISELLLMERLGIDAVGMSTVPEVILARFYGMKVLGLSCITDNAFEEGVVQHEKVIQIAKECGEKISFILNEFLMEV
ncbi:MAG: purine-nucleoside phosphorylase [Caldisericaceae bacterium]